MLIYTRIHVFAVANPSHIINFRSENQTLSHICIKLTFTASSSFQNFWNEIECGLSFEGLKGCVEQ